MEPAAAAGRRKRAAGSPEDGRPVVPNTLSRSRKRRRRQDAAAARAAATAAAALAAEAPVSGGRADPRATNGTTAAVPAAAAAITTKQDRVWQYVQRRSVLLVSQTGPAAQEDDDDEQRRRWVDEAMRWGIPDPAVLRHLDEEWAPSRRTAETEVVVADGTRVRVTVTSEAAAADAWVARQGGATAFGMDTEWRPQFRKGAGENKVALLQLCGPAADCLIVQMLFLDRVPAGVAGLLADPGRKLAGVGVAGDAAKLRRDWGLACAGEVELTSLAAQAFKSDGLRRAGLKQLAREVVRVDVDKTRKVTMSNWARKVLDWKQVQYACTDAWVSLAIFDALVQRPGVAVAGVGAGAAVSGVEAAVAEGAAVAADGSGGELAS